VLIGSGLYQVSDSAGGLIVAMSAFVLYFLGNHTPSGSRLGLALANICFWAALSIGFVACIYWAFAISVDFGLQARGWLKAASGICAFISGALGLRFIILLRQWRR
tara:strand:+ start:2539 stop:2856 length:318 start_codon:yes stop_codon:yes gene_type:complete